MDDKMGDESVIMTTAFFMTSANGEAKIFSFKSIDILRRKTLGPRNL